PPLSSHPPVQSVVHGSAEAPSELFSPLGSSWNADTSTELLIVSGCVGVCTTTSTVAEPSTPMLPREQNTEDPSPGPQVPWLGVAETKAPGSDSNSCTSVASSGPAFVTVDVNSSLSPGVKKGGLGSSATPTSAVPGPSPARAVPALANAATTTTPAA